MNDVPASSIPARIVVCASFARAGDAVELVEPLIGWLAPTFRRIATQMPLAEERRGISHGFTASASVVSQSVMPPLWVAPVRIA